MANQGRNFGLHQVCRLKAQEKFDLAAAVTALRWVESVTGRRLGTADLSTVRSERDVAHLLKDGTALCEVMNHIKPGAIKKYHPNPNAFQQMENTELFLRACIDYGMKTIDTFHVKELYEARAVYTVINCIYALGSLAQQQGYTGPKLGVKLAERNERHFSAELVQQARQAVSRQHSVPRDTPSQAHMTPYGLPRQILLGGEAAHVDRTSHSVIGLQYGSNQVASQAGMTAYGMQRQISTSTSSEGDLNTSTTLNDLPTPTPTSPPDTPTSPPPQPKSPPSTPTTTTTHNPILNTAKPPSRHSEARGGSAVIGLQYGSNRVASQAGMTAYGMARQIVSPTTPTMMMRSVKENGEAEKDDVF